MDSLILEKDNSKTNGNNGQQVDRGDLKEEEEGAGDVKALVIHYL